MKDDIGKIVLPEELRKETIDFLIEDGQKWVTIKVAADLCGVSSSTMRRRAQAGEIISRMVDMPHGKTLYALLDDVERVKSALTMLTVKQATGKQDMAFAVASLVGDYLKERDSEVISKLNDIQAENKALQDALNELRAEIPEMLKNAIQGKPEAAEATPEDKPKKSFWSIFQRSDKK